MDKHPGKLRIKNCCLGHYKFMVDGKFCCLLADVVECDNKGDEIGESKLHICKTQIDCHDCEVFHSWMATGIPAEEWVEIR